MTDNEELARRAVQSKSWRWMPGMMTNLGRVVGENKEPFDGLLIFTDNTEDLDSSLEESRLPDLTDPATLGCLLNLVRAHWGDDGAHTRRLYRYGGGEKWLCCAPSVVYPAMQTDGTTEAECLVKALEMEVVDDND